MVYCSLYVELINKKVKITKYSCHWQIKSCFPEKVMETEEKESLQANSHNKCHSNFKHFGGKNPLDIVHKSHYMDNNENLQRGKQNQIKGQGIASHEPSNRK